MIELDNSLCINFLLLKKKITFLNESPKMYLVRHVLRVAFRILRKDYVNVEVIHIIAMFVLKVKGNVDVID